jgi:hypothetical protein
MDIERNFSPEPSTPTSVLVFPRRCSSRGTVSFKRPSNKNFRSPEKDEVESLEEANDLINELQRELYWKDLLYLKDINAARRRMREREEEAAIHYAEILRCHAFLEEYARNHNLHICVECKKEGYRLKDNFTDTSLAGYIPAVEARGEKQKKLLKETGSISGAVAIETVAPEDAVTGAPTESAKKRTQCVAARMFSIYPRLPCQCSHCTDDSFFECEACSKGELCDRCKTPFAQFMLRDKFSKCMCRPCREVRNYYDTAHPMYQWAQKNRSARLACNCPFCRGKYHPTDMPAIHDVYRPTEERKQSVAHVKKRRHDKV